MWDLGELKHRDTTSPLSTSMALSHQFIWSSTNLMLCFMRSGGSSLAWPTTAGDEESRRQDAVRLHARGSSPQPDPARPQLTVHGCRGSSAHASVLDLVHRLCGPLPLLFSLGWCGGCRGCRGSALGGGGICCSRRPFSLFPWFHEDNRLLQRGWGRWGSRGCWRWWLL